ncbi:MAG: hypothetical protein ABIL25_02350 [candidate division WOR-3 bacterium]
MSLKRIRPLLLVASLVALLAGCSQPRNHNPVISSLTATPDGTVRPGTAVAISVSAADEDGDVLEFTWSATTGTLSATRGETVTWTAPNGAASGTVTVVCRDGRGGEDVATRNVSSRAWYSFNMDGYTPESTYLANPGTSETTFEFELDGDPFPSGAIVDSAFVTTDFEPLDELELEQFNVWVVTPTGTRVLIYDGFNLTNLAVDEMALPGIAGESAEGPWRLRVTREAKGIEGYADECCLTVFYHY